VHPQHMGAGAWPRGPSIRHDSRNSPAQVARANRVRAWGVTVKGGSDLHCVQKASGKTSVAHRVYVHVCLCRFE